MKQLGAAIKTSKVSRFVPLLFPLPINPIPVITNTSLLVSQAIFLRNLAYLYKTTKDAALRSSIATVINKSAAAALATCDRDWDCVGDWSTNGTQVYPEFRSTHLVAAALVAAEGIKSF